MTRGRIVTGSRFRASTRRCGRVGASGVSSVTHARQLHAPRRSARAGRVLHRPPRAGRLLHGHSRRLRPLDRPPRVDVVGRPGERPRPVDVACVRVHQPGGRRRQPVSRRRGRPRARRRVSAVVGRADHVEPLVPLGIDRALHYVGRGKLLAQAPRRALPERAHDRDRPVSHAGRDVEHGCDSLLVVAHHRGAPRSPPARSRIYRLEPARRVSTCNGRSQRRLIPAGPH